jgi:hypothetical protein
MISNSFGIQSAAMEFHGECAVGPRIELLGHPIESDGT